MTNPTDEIRSLIQNGSAASTAPGARPERPNATARAREADIRTLAQQARPAPDADIASEVTSPRKWLLTMLVAIAMALAAVALWRGTQPTPTGHAATLAQLAQAVEQYRSAHTGSLPPQLTPLVGFPKTAVEWQLAHWRARDAAGRTEIMLAPNGPRHYRLVLRQGSEIWVYNDQDGQARQTHK